jgi:hydroxyethylthiazole kinase
VVGCYAAVCDDLLTGTVAAMAVLSVAGEIAAAGAKGPGSFRVGLLDALHGLDPQVAENAANVSVL